MASDSNLSEPLDRYECRACGYIYEPEKGDNARHISAGTAFKELPDKWACPICSAPVSQFSNIGPVGSPSGFKENLGYGIGVNSLPPGKKNLLIFGVLGLFILILLSFYGLG
jgi:rubredoxin